MISTVTVGSATSSQWIPVDYTQTPFNLGIQVVTSGTHTWKVEMTMDNPLDASVTPTAVTAPSPLETGSATEQGGITIPCRAVRLTVTPYTNGSSIMTVVQGRKG